MDRWERLPKMEAVEKAVASLNANGIDTFFAEGKDEAKKKIFDLIPKGAEVMNMTSMTLEALDVPDEINASQNYSSVRNKIKSMDKKTQGKEMKMLGAAPDYAIGSVHAVTQEGHLFIASNTGSQLAAYAYGASHVIFVVGTHKIVKNMDEAIKRIYHHCLPLEDARARKAYGEGSFVSKLLILNREVAKDRIKLIFVNEVLGF